MNISNETHYSDDPLVLRKQYAEDYKIIESHTISALLPPNTDTKLWSKKQVLERINIEIPKLDDEQKIIARTDLNRAAGLRDQAMNLWPAGTEAARRHWDWIDILKRIIQLLQTSDGPDGTRQRQAIVAGVPASADTPWTLVDFDVYLDQMTHWREMVKEIWHTAVADPKQMSVADISLGCAVRHFRTEIIANITCYPEWHNKATGAFNPDILKYMAYKQPDGTGGELVKIIESLKEKENVDKMQSILNNAKLSGFPTKLEDKDVVWTAGDAARHRNPLIDWMIDIVRTNKHHISHPELMLAYLFVLDSMKVLESDLRAAKVVTVGKLTEILKAYQPMKSLIRSDALNYQAIHEVVGERVQAMTKYVMKQNTIPSLAIAHTWADYCNVALNSYLFSLLPLNCMAYLFDCNMIMGRLDKLTAAAEVEQFCNRYKRGLYLGGRPTDEVSWKAAVREWIMVTDLDGYMRTQQRIEREDVWVRFAMDDQKYTTPLKFGFNMRSGTKLWWQAIREKAAQELQEPSLVKVHARVDAAYTRPYVGNMFLRLLRLNWKAKRRAVDRILNEFQFSARWFEGVL